MYIGITVIGIIAVFTGNLLFTEYQSYKFEKEIEKLEEEQEKKEMAEAKEYAMENVKFGKPIIMENEDKWELKISNRGNQYIYGYFKVEMFDENGNEVLSEFVNISSRQLLPYGEFIYKGDIDKEYKDKVYNYKIKNAELYASE